MIIHNLPRGRGREHVSWRKARWFYFFIMPWLLGLICLSLIPLAVAFAMSLSNFNGLNATTVKFIGLGNYLRALGDANALYALRRTFVFALMDIPLNLVLSLSIALLLTQRMVGQGLFRTLFYIPSIVPIVAVAWIWKLMMDNNFGLVNTMLDRLFPGTTVRWMTEYPTFVLVMMSLWAGVGGAVVIFMAGLQGVPKELEEAARMDGANFWQMFRAITIPFITPVIFYQTIIAVIGSLQALIGPILLAPAQSEGLSAVPPRENYLFMVYVYNQIFTNLRYGYGSALLWLLFVLILVLTLGFFRLGKYWVYYEVDQEEAA